MGRSVITDFGLAVHKDGSRLYYHSFQPGGYRSPEAIFAAGWSYSVDVWNLGSWCKYVQSVTCFKNNCGLMISIALGVA